MSLSSGILGSSVLGRISAPLIGSGLLRRALSGEGLSTFISGVASRARLGATRASSVVRRFVGARGGVPKVLRLVDEPVTMSITSAHTHLCNTSSVAANGVAAAALIKSSGAASYLRDSIEAYGAANGVSGLALVSGSRRAVSMLPDSVLPASVLRFVPTVGLVQSLHSGAIGHCAFGAGRVRSIFRRLYSQGGV